MIDLLHAVDWFVDKPQESAYRVQSVLRLPLVDPNWIIDDPRHQYEAVFLKADELTSSPTRLEFIRTLDPRDGVPVCSVPPISTIASLQGQRLQRTHATVLCVADFDKFTDDLRRGGTNVWVEPACEHLPHQRGWIGWAPDGTRDSDPPDAGLFLEYIPTAVLGRKVAASVSAPVDRNSQRVSRRVHLVGDLDSAVRALDRSVGLAPIRPVERDQRTQAKLARYEFRHGGSAALELVQPLSAGPAADYFAEWGPGPWFTSLALLDSQQTHQEAVAAGADDRSSEDLCLLEIGTGPLFELHDCQN